MILAHDPEAYTDDYTFQNANSGSSNLPAGTDYGQMTLQPPEGGGVNWARLIRPVTRPETSLLYLTAGVVAAIGQDRTIWGSQSAGAGPQWATCFVQCEACPVRCTWTGITPALGDIVIPTAGSFDGNIVAQGSATAAQFAQSIGRVISTLDITGSALGSSGTSKLVLVKMQVPCI